MSNDGGCQWFDRDRDHAHARSSRWIGDANWPLDQPVRVGLPRNGRECGLLLTCQISWDVSIVPGSGEAVGLEALLCAMAFDLHAMSSNTIERDWWCT